MKSSEPKEPVVERSGDAQSADLTGRALQLRIRQQELLAELGVLALQGASFAEMLNHTARATAEGLGAEYCKVMEYVPAENRLLVRAGVGWDEGVVGHDERGDKCDEGAKKESHALSALTEFLRKLGPSELNFVTNQLAQLAYCVAE